MFIIHQILVDFVHQTAITVAETFYPIQTKEMKKVYAIVCIFAALIFAWCSLKIQKPSEVLTGEMFSGTETMPVVSGSEMEEFTGNFDSWTVPVLTGSEGVNVNSGVTAEVKTMIEERNKLSGDDSKLTEEDIDLMEKIIQKVQNLEK